MTTGMRLIIGSGIILGVSVYMLGLGASSSWQYYLTVDECVANSTTLVQAPVRVSGTVAADSLQTGTLGGEAVFVLQGGQGRLRVSCPGDLPENIAEGKEVVVEGRLQSGNRLRADRVLTRCASKYSSGTAAASTVRREPGRP
jgi:cytochrome c-type biogenesis protein CcmE